MSFVARAERTIEAPPQRVFDRLADVASWPSWMPRSFQAVVERGAPSPVRLGDKVRVKINGAPVAATLKVSVVDRPRELAWRGGVRGILWAEHRFVLEPDGDHRTHVQSIETWHGALAGILRRIVEPAAIKVGSQQLEALAKASSLAN